MAIAANARASAPRITAAAWQPVSRVSTPALRPLVSSKLVKVTPRASPVTMTPSASFFFPTTAGQSNPWHPPGHPPQPPRVWQPPHQEDTRRPPPLHPASLILCRTAAVTRTTTTRNAVRRVRCLFCWVFVVVEVYRIVAGHRIRVRVTSRLRTGRNFPRPAGRPT